MAQDAAASGVRELNALPISEESKLNIVISFAGLEPGQGSRPYALRHLAGGTILSHILYHLIDLPFERLIVLLEEGAEAVQRWAAEVVPDTAVETIVVDPTANSVTAVQACAEVVGAQGLLFIAGHLIAEAEYGRLISGRQAACCLLQPEQDEAEGGELLLDDSGRIDPQGERSGRWAGACWFRDGADLLGALGRWQEASQPRIVDILYSLVVEGLQVGTARAVLSLDTRTNADMFYANARLLGLNHGTADAIERSYAEDFTVLPPVFLHETAVIESSVVGPFVNLEASATIRNSVVRNSLIGEGAQISNAVLDSSLIGDNAVVNAKYLSIVVDADTSLDI